MWEGASSAWFMRMRCGASSGARLAGEPLRRRTKDGSCVSGTRPDGALSLAPRQVRLTAALAANTAILPGVIRPPALVTGACGLEACLRACVPAVSLSACSSHGCWQAPAANLVGRRVHGRRQPGGGAGARRRLPALRCGDALGWALESCCQAVQAVWCCAVESCIVVSTPRAMRPRRYESSWRWTRRA